jgi:hypothetical protein
MRSWRAEQRPMLKDSPLDGPLPCVPVCTFGECRFLPIISVPGCTVLPHCGQWPGVSLATDIHALSLAACPNKQKMQETFPGPCIWRIPGSAAWEREQGDAMDAHPSSAIKGQRAYLRPLSLSRTRARSCPRQAHLHLTPAGGKMLLDMDGSVLVSTPAGEGRHRSLSAGTTTDPQCSLSFPAAVPCVLPLATIFRAAHTHHTQTGRNGTAGLSSPGAQIRIICPACGQNAREILQTRTGPDTQTAGACAQVRRETRSVPDRTQPLRPYARPGMHGSAPRLSLPESATASSGDLQPARSLADRWPSFRLCCTAALTATRVSWNMSTGNRRQNITSLTGRGGTRRRSAISDPHAQAQRTRGCQRQRTHGIPAQVPHSISMHSYPFPIDVSLSLEKEMP